MEYPLQVRYRTVKPLPSPMGRSIRSHLSIASTVVLALASAPAIAEPVKVAQGTAADLGVMGVKLRDAVKFNWGFQGALQGAGTPNEAGIGAFIPLKVGDNSVFFLDTLANVNFSDFSDYSSIINTKVKGATVSTSTRLGYRWLNKDRSWMFGVNAGYDSRPMATGGTDNGVTVTDSKTIFFQQVALNLEAVSNKWFTSAYLLYPIGEYGYNKAPAVINSVYTADSVMTAGIDIGYNLTPNLKASAGYYYSEGDAGAANGNSVRGRLEYNIANGLTSGINIAYDPAFSEGYSSGEFYKTLNLSVDLKWRFGANGYGAPSIRNKQPVVIPVIQALSATPENRNVRVHDMIKFDDTTIMKQGYCMTLLEENVILSRVRWHKDPIGTNKILELHKSLWDGIKCSETPHPHNRSMNGTPLNFRFAPVSYNYGQSESVLNKEMHEIIKRHPKYWEFIDKEYWIKNPK